jgi:YD repeat-containing protein
VNGNTATCNAEDQLTSLTATNGATENLYYEALGTRVKKVISGTGGSTTVYVSDAFGLEAEYVGGTWAKDYIANGSGQLVATENALSPAQLVLRRQTTSAASA